MNSPWTLSLLLSFFFCACSAATRVISPQRPAIEQRLLVRSLERALAQLDTGPLKGKQVFIDLYGLTSDQEFARQLLFVTLREQGVRIANQRDKAELELKVFTSVLGVDQANSFIGIPPLIVPVVNVPVPELSLYRVIQNRSMSEIKIYAFDARSGDFVEKSPAAVGTAKYDDYTILLFISFTVTDLNKVDEKTETAGFNSPSEANK